jgi:hypothetical protein
MEPVPPDALENLPVPFVTTYVPLKTSGPSLSVGQSRPEIFIAKLTVPFVFWIVPVPVAGAQKAGRFEMGKTSIEVSTLKSIVIVPLANP